MTTERTKYQSVNGQWPEGTNEGRALKPTAQEAVTAARRLYRIGFAACGIKRTFRGKVKLVSGNRRTYVRSGVLNVNPDVGHHYTTKGPDEPAPTRKYVGGGWHELVHDLSHYVARRAYGDAHGARHAFIEREMITAVVNGGWLDGKLKREEKPAQKPDTKRKRYERIVARIATWEAKKKRAEKALKKLHASRKRYEKQLTIEGV